MSSYYEKFLDGRVVCIDEEIPFEIPEGWEWCRLGASVSMNPRNTATDDLDAGFIPMAYIDPDLSNKFKFDIRKWKTIKSGFTHLADGDVAFAKITPCITNLKAAVMKGLPNGIAAGTTELNVFRCYYDTIVAEYILYYLATPYILVDAVYKGTAGQQRIMTQYLASRLLPIPPYKEQQRIVDKIKALLPVIQKYNYAQDAVNTLNEEIYSLLQKSILQEAIQGKLLPQVPSDEPAQTLLERIAAEKQQLVKEGKLKAKDGGTSIIFKGDDNKYYEKAGNATKNIDDEIPFPIPSSWVWCRLDDICSYIHRGKSPKYSEIKKVPVIAQKCNQWSGFNIEKAQFIDPSTIKSYSAEHFLQQNDLLWNSTGLGTLGRMAMYEIEKNPYGIAVADSHVTVIRPMSGYVNPKYLYYYFSSPTVQSVIEDRADGSTKQKELSTKTVSAYIIPLPPRAEQDWIVYKIEEVLASIMSR